MIKKCLKGLCMLGLIILPINFSSAVNVINDIGEYEYLCGSNYCTVNADLSFECTDTNNVIVGCNTSNWQPSSTSYFWTNEGLGFYYYFNNNHSYNAQGIVSMWRVCPNGNCSDSSQLPALDYSGFVQYINTHELIGWQWLSMNSNPGNAGVSLHFSDGSQVYSIPQDLRGTYGDYVSYNFSLAGWGQNADYSNIAINSPFYSNNIPLPDYTVNPSKPITNQDALEGCIYAGLDLPYCFGGFDIDNIFQPGEDYEAFTGYHFGSGAAIWTLYDLYSGAYSTPKNFMGSLRGAYLNKQFNRFYTEPKALFMIVHQYYSMYDRGQINFQWLDVWDFCDLTYKLSKGDLQLTDEYTGGNNTCTNGYSSKKTNESQGSFHLSGFLNSGTGKVISADEFFGRLTNLMNDNISRFEGEFDPIIPSYIIVFMLAIILIRLISH